MEKYTCLRTEFDGKGLIETKDIKVRLNNLLEGEIVTLKQVKKSKKTFYQVQDFINKSDKRINTKCSSHLECGGCQYQHMTYDEEVRLKEAYLTNLLKNYKYEKLPFVRMKDPHNYRNKCQMTFKLSKTNKIVTGFYKEGTHEIVVVDDCNIHCKKGNEIIKHINDVLNKNKIQPYSELNQRGTVRHVLVRYGFDSGEIMVVLVTNGEMFHGRNNVVKELVKRNLGITTIVQNINPRETSIVLNDKERVLYGPGFIYDRLNGLKFKISSRSFYQVNPVSTSILYEQAIKLAQIKKTDTVIDTYCGIGTIGLLASKEAKFVIGVELNKDAFKDAITNAKINNINNIKFVNEDSTKFMQQVALEDEKVDVLIMDPPRDGSTKEFIESVEKLNPKTVVYISCEPKSLVNDLKHFDKAGYVLRKIQGVDQFPRTFNLEVIAILSK